MNAGLHDPPAHLFDLLDQSYKPTRVHVAAALQNTRRGRLTKLMYLGQQSAQQ
jgi:hypothetical protein